MSKAVTHYWKPINQILSYDAAFYECMIIANSKELGPKFLQLYRDNVSRATCFAFLIESKMLSKMAKHLYVPRMTPSASYLLNIETYF